MIKRNHMFNQNSKLLVKNLRDHGFDARIVGGAVRDHILGRNSKDIDFCTDATVTEMVQIFNNNGFHWIPTGADHGTLTVIIDKDLFEITTLRIDQNCDGRHAQVEFTRDWQQDASRRDLTINALMMDVDGQIHDFFNGIDDINNKVVRFIGNPDDRITEDFLRILRAFRFASVLGFDIDQDAIQAITKHKDGLKQISKERIWMEFLKILPDFDMLNFMNQVGILDVIGIDFNPDRTHFDRVKDSNNTALLLAAVTKNDAQDLKTKLVLPNDIFKVVDSVRKDKVKDLPDVLMLNRFQKDVALFNGIVIPNDLPIFPVTGDDLIDRGFLPGPDMGKMLNKMKADWAKSQGTLNKNQLMKGL